jgi:hypothetical protein
VNGVLGFVSLNFEKRIGKVPVCSTNYIAGTKALCGEKFRVFFKDLLKKKVCTAFSRARYKSVPLANLNKYLHNDTSETASEYK